MKCLNQTAKKDLASLNKQYADLRKEREALVEKSSIYLSEDMANKEKMMLVVNIVIATGDLNLISAVTEVLKVNHKTS